MKPVRAADIRPLTSRADYDACVRLQRAVWGEEFVDVVPGTILMVARRLGGVAAGAFDSGGRLLGFVFGITGRRGGEPVHWSDMLAVLPVARGAGLGKRLKLYQRERLLASGVRRVQWTYDPLVTRNANLNLNGLGAAPVEYVVNLYGDTHSTLHAGLDTDRFIVEWRLDDARVERRLMGRTDPLPASARKAPIVDLGRLAAGGEPPAAPWVRIAVPADVEALRTADPVRTRAWQRMHRRAFAWYLANGYRVAGFEHRRAPADSHYLVTNVPGSGVAPAATATR